MMRNSNMDGCTAEEIYHLLRRCYDILQEAATGAVHPPMKSICAEYDFLKEWTEQRNFFSRDAELSFISSDFPGPPGDALEELFLDYLRITKDSLSKGL